MRLDPAGEVLLDPGGEVTAEAPIDRIILPPARVVMTGCSGVGEMAMMRPRHRGELLYLDPCGEFTAWSEVR